MAFITPARDDPPFINRVTHLIKSVLSPHVLEAHHGTRKEISAERTARIGETSMILIYIYIYKKLYVVIMIFFLNNTGDLQTRFIHC